jgi:hypothetical protein
MEPRVTAGRHLVPPQCFHGCGPPGAARGHCGAAVSGTLGAPPFGCRVCGAPSLWGWWLACGVGGSARTAVVLHKLASRARAWLRERAASGGRVFAISGAGPSLLCFAWHGGSHRWLAAVVRLPHLHSVGAFFHSALCSRVYTPPPPSAAIALCSFQAFQRSEAHPVEASAAILRVFFPGQLAAMSQGLAGRGRGGAKRRNFGVFVGSLSQGFLLVRLLCSATRAPPSAGDEPEDRLVLLVAFHALLLARDIRRSDVVSRPQLVLPVRCISAAHARGGRLETHLLLCRRTL